MPTQSSLSPSAPGHTALVPSRGGAENRLQAFVPAKPWGGRGGMTCYPGQHLPTSGTPPHVWDHFQFGINRHELTLSYTEEVSLCSLWFSFHFPTSIKGKSQLGARVSDSTVRSLNLPMYRQQVSCVGTALGCHFTALFLLIFSYFLSSVNFPLKMYLRK